MEDTKTGRTMDRRQFTTLAAALAALSGVAITISACGGDSSPSSPNGGTGGTASDEVGDISNNHGHSAVITAAQLTAGGALSLDIRGTSSHPHTVALTAAEIGTVAAGGRVSKDSSTDNGHSHTVTFN